jgi:hypothetical protein
MDWRQDPEKPLPRGLEHVSHLFLSQSQSQRERVSEEPDSAAAESAAVVVLRPCRFLSRSELLSVLKQQAGALEDGMRAIDANIPCDSAGSIDLLAVDRVNTLIVIDLDDRLNDGLLLRGIGHLDWLVRNIPNLVRMYQGQVIDFSNQPRLFLVAPEFSALFQRAARQFTSLRIDCLKYHSVALAGGTGVLFEHAFGNDRTEAAG